jgi:NAD(P)-dependent dehydrogenase (short-subunit alcohol dehydrogenase family)
VVVLTGGAGVLATAMAESLVAGGARVALLERDADRAVAVAKNLNAQGGQAIPLISDVLDPGQLAKARQELLGQWGRIDVLINAAGGNMKGATIGPQDRFFDMDPDAFDRVNRLNLHGTVLPSMVFGETMAEQGGGSSINISSMASAQAITRVVGYSAAKAAIDNFTRWLAVELATKYGEGLRVNAIAPGFLVGEQNRQLLLNEDGSYTKRGQTIIDLTPMRRFGEPEELCGAIHYLASPASRFVTGVVIPIDGGFSAFSGV